MKIKNYQLKFCILLIYLTNSMSVFGQYAMYPGARVVSPKNDPMTGGIRNYKTFTIKPVDLSEEVIAANKGYEHHPEIGTLYENAPGKDCYELIGERTEINKVFVKKGSDGKEIYEQTASAPIHYKDANGNWRTIKGQLEPDKNRKGVYAAYEQPAPVSVDANNKIVSIGKSGNCFRFNNNLELVYKRQDGTEVSLGNANWTNHTAGDEGVYVTNAWHGIDIEMYVVRGAVKTNFLIRHALPEYAAGELLIRDHLKMDQGLSLYAGGQTTHAGNMEIRNGSGEKVYDISAATACEKGNMKKTMQALDYYIKGDILDIALPGNFLNRGESSYPVIIDPLVSLATSSTVTGSSYSAFWTVPCVYTNLATVPANITITDIQYAFTFTTGSFAWVTDGAIDFRKTTCRSPLGTTGATGAYWWCSLAAAGPGSCAATGGTTYSIYSDLSACVPAPQCASYNLNLTMDFYNSTAAGACSSTYIYASTPLTITVKGHTVEFVSATASPSTICSGGSATLTALGDYGVSPYTYAWSPGALSGTPVTVTPGTTTAYSLTITDACGITATGSVSVFVDVIAAITGTTTICVGNTTVLSDATGGAHSWSSSNPGVATITAGGVVTGISAGTTTITYTSTASGCTATIVVTVLANPGAISGVTSLCTGGTTVLTDATTGGTWSSSNPGVATIDAATGVVTAVSSGTTTISYTLASGCFVTTTITVTLLSAIAGPTSVCAGSTINLTDATLGGTWSSSTTAVATVSTTGVVTGVTAGTATITYTAGSGCFTTTSITVYNIAPITGTTSVCVGGTTVLSDAAGAGTWTSSNPAVATVSTTGVVTGVSSGIVTITFVTTAGGCSATTTVTVNTVAAITGPTSVCLGSTITLSDATAGGTWSSSTTAVATISTTGVVTGVAAGTTTITYTAASGCNLTASVTVYDIEPITGTTSVCVGGTTILSDAAGAGTWTSSNPAIATISTTGVVTGVSSGMVTITFVTTAGGCSATTTVTVNTVAAITGPTSVCLGSTITLSDATVGGTWSSSTTAVATISTTGVVTGVTTGTATITYTAASGCNLTASVTVYDIEPITGTTTVCVGGTTVLSDAAGAGTWTSSNPAVATVSTTGVVTGVSSGIVTITFVTTAGGCSATTTVTVNMVAAITGPTSVCLGSTITLSDATGGGSWVSSNPAVATISTTGVVTGVTAGTVTITYTASTGCTSTATVTVYDIAPITGITTVCAGLTTALSDAAGAGTWTSSNPAVATVSTTGVVTGVAAGVITITFITTAGSCSATTTITVNSVAAIAGPSSVCLGSAITLADATSGGSWVSSNPAVATVSTTGVVTGVTPGTVTITYTAATGCTSTFSVTVYNIVPITGITTVCVGNTTPLSDAAGAGTWTSSNIAIATVSTTGVVTGVSAGIVTITFVTTAGSCSATTTVTVSDVAAITGITTLCTGETTTLADVTASGTWSSSNPGVASVGTSTGIVTALSAGVTTITYTSAASCVSTVLFTVTGIAPITGITSICAGGTTTLADAGGPGTWSSSSIATATVGAATGIVNGVSAGTVTISFTNTLGCSSFATVTINGIPDITGTMSVCVDNTTTLGCTIGGGTWSCPSTAIATINAVTGVVTGVSGGSAIVTYTTPAGCFSAITVVIDPLPAGITGIWSICQGFTTILNDGTAGGSWTSSNPLIAPITPSGVINGTSGGAVTITYTSVFGCIATANVTVNSTPPSITGTVTVCKGFVTTLYDAMTGGTWASDNNAIATVDAVTGVVTGISPGTTLVTYTSSFGCFITTSVTVNPIPPTINGNTQVCVYATTTLTNSMSTGAWTSSAPAIATIDGTTGLITGISAGISTITYSVLGCITTDMVTVNPIPPAITGLSNMCEQATEVLANSIPGGTWSSRNPYIAIIDPVSGLLTGNNYGADTITYTAPTGCLITGVVIIDSAPKVSFYVNPNLCVGDVTKIELTVASPEIISYTWGFDSAKIISSSSNSFGPFYVSWANPGTYLVTVTGNAIVHCPSLSAQDTILVHPYPHAAIQPPVFLDGNPNVCIGDSILFRAGYNDDSYDYFWTPAHFFEQNNIENVYGKIELAGYVTLKVTDAFGCTATDSILIDAKSCCLVAIPNAFTPNGDGLNDLFRPVSLGRHQVRMFRVVNRWGQSVYETVTQNIGWDGTFNGVPQDVDTYFYFFSYDCDGKTVIEQGDVTLIR